MFKVGIITASDKGYNNEREDRSGKLIEEIVSDRGYNVVRYIVLPDEEEQLMKEMKYLSDEMQVDLVLTTGGTGFSPRDVTPEATRKVVDRLSPGISEAIRSYSLQITPRAMLSRAVSGIRKNTLIINLPGSPKAVKESLEYILDSLHHGLEIMTGKTSECGKDVK